MSALKPNVALVSTSAKVGMDALAVVAAALQKQVTRDFAPIWEIDATVSPFAGPDDVPTGYWTITIMDDIGQAGNVMGLHRDNQGQPFSLVSSTEDWSLTASHECLEMLADPFGCRLISCDSPAKGQGRVQVLLEVCDPCQAKEFSYSVNGVLVSDFITPYYFDPLVSSGVKYSFTASVEEPLGVLTNGYLSYVVTETNVWWQKLSVDPFFKELGQLVPANGCWRSQIDARSGDISGQGLTDRSVATAAGHPVEVNRRASVARAAALRDSIAELVKYGNHPAEKLSARPARRTNGK